MQPIPTNHHLYHGCQAFLSGNFCHSEFILRLSRDKCQVNSENKPRFGGEKMLLLLMYANIPYNSVLQLHHSFLYIFCLLSVLAVFGLGATIISFI